MLQPKITCDKCGETYPAGWPHLCESSAPMSEPGVFEPKWPDGLKPNEFYGVLCDDKGRNGGTWMKILVAGDGDVHVSMQDWEDVPSGSPDPLPTLRVRTLNGGGRNHRTHQALLWLADAIRRDNEENGRETP